MVVNWKIRVISTRIYIVFPLVLYSSFNIILWNIYKNPKLFEKCEHCAKHHIGVFFFLLRFIVSLRNMNEMLGKIIALLGDSILYVTYVYAESFLRMKLFIFILIIFKKADPLEATKTATSNSAKKKENMNKVVVKKRRK